MNVRICVSLHYFHFVLPRPSHVNIFVVKTSFDRWTPKVKLISCHFCWPCVLMMLCGKKLDKSISINQVIVEVFGEKANISLPLFHIPGYALRRRKTEKVLFLDHISILRTYPPIILPSSEILPRKPMYNHSCHCSKAICNSYHCHTWRGNFETKAGREGWERKNN